MEARLEETARNCVIRVMNDTLGTRAVEDLTPDKLDLVIREITLEHERHTPRPSLWGGGDPRIERHTKLIYDTMIEMARQEFHRLVRRRQMEAERGGEGLPLRPRPAAHSSDWDWEDEEEEARIERLAHEAYLLAQQDADEEDEDEVRTDPLPMIPLKRVSCDPEACPVCMEPFAAGEQIPLLPCLHEFHLSCWRSYVERKARNRDIQCLLCRTRVYEEEGEEEEEGVVE